MASIVIPISQQGAQQVAQQITAIGTAAQQTAAQVNLIGGPNSVASLNRLGSAGNGAISGVNGLTDALTRNASSLAYLLRSIAPIGGGFAVMAAQMERGALMIEHMSAAAGEHITKQQVLNAAFNEGTIAAATMESAVEKVTTVTQAAQAATQAYAAAQAVTAQASKDVAAAQLLIAQRRQDVLTTKGLGDPKADAIAQRDLTAAVIAGNDAMIVKREALIAEAPLRANAISQIQQQAEAEKVLAEANAASSFSLGATIGIISGVIAILVVLIATILAVKKAWDTLTEAVKAAAEEQSAALTFSNVIGNAQIATDQLKQITDFWKGAGAIFTLPDLEKAATGLSLFGANAQDVARYTRDLGAAAASTNKTVSEMGAAFELVMYGRIRKPTEDTLPILRALSVEIYGTENRIKDVIASISHGEIPAMTIAKALDDAAHEGGIFFNALQTRAETFDGQLNILKTRWQVFLLALGAPIVDSLTPMIDSWNDAFSGSESSATKWGQAVAAAIDSLAPRVKQFLDDALNAINEGDIGGFLVKGVLTALQKLDEAVWTEIFVTLPEEAIDKLVTYIENIDWNAAWGNAKEAARSAYEAMVSSYYGGRGGTTDIPTLPQQTITPGGGVITPGGLTAEEQAAYVAGIPMPKPPPPLEGPLGLSSFVQRPQLTGAGSATDAFASDTAKINDMWEKFASIQANAGTSLERNRALMDVMLTTADKLYDPSQLQAYAKALQDEGIPYGDLIIKQAEVLRQQKAMDEEIKIGAAGAWDSFDRGAQKSLASVDNFSKAWERVGQETVQILTNDISQGLTDILNGTKSVAQGFKDMVVSILKDLSQMALKIELEIVLINALKAIGGGGGGFSGVTYGEGSAVSTDLGPLLATAQTGGPITGGSGVRDDVPIMAQGGEYMMSKAAVNRIGLSNLEAMNKGMAAGGLVTSSRTFYGDFYDKNTIPPGYFINAYGNLQSVESLPPTKGPGYTATGQGTFDPLELQIAPPTYLNPDFYDITGGSAGSFVPDTGGGGGTDTQGFITASGGDPYGYNSRTMAEEAKWAATPGSHAPGSRFEIRQELAFASPQGIGSGTFAGENLPTSFESAVGGLYGGLEGGVGTGSVGGFSGAASAFGGGSGGLKPTRQYLEFGGFIYPIPSFETGGIMPWTGPAYLHAGEEITPASGSKSSSVTNNIQVHVEYGDQGGAKARTTGSDDQDARSLANAIKVTVVNEINKQREFGGALYRPRNSRS
jgi:hypothetical protein